MARWDPDALQPCEPSRVNQLGGLFVNGCPLPDAKRRKIVELAQCGLRAADISRHLKVSNGCVSKILTRYYKVGIVHPKAMGGHGPRISTPQLVARIAQLKQEQPSLFAWEIREKLEAEGICAAGRMPSISSINRILRRLETPDRFLFPPKPPEPGLPLTGERKWVSPAEAPISPPNSQETERAAGLPRARTRTIFSKQQLEALENAFQRSQYPKATPQAELAQTTGLPEVAIRVWFSNRRARWRRETTQAWNSSSGLTWAIPGAICEWRLPTGAPSPQPSFSPLWPARTPPPPAARRPAVPRP